MKYLSLIIFCAGLIWTWKLIHNESETPFETHAAIQERMAVMISESVKAKKPAAEDIVVERVWTESTGKDQLRAHFIYSYSEQVDHSKVTSKIQGQGDLEKQGDDGSGQERWALKKISTSNDSVMFDEALVITTGDEPTPEAPSTTTPSTH